MTGQDHSPAHALEQGDAGLSLQTLHLLRHGARGEASGGGGRDDGAVAVDGLQGGQGLEIDHEEMLLE